MEKSKVSLKTLADELNLSMTTISRALRDCSDIGEKTKKIVREKALELGYIPDSSARSLAVGKTRTIALVIDNLSSPYFSLIVEKMISQLKKANYRSFLILCEKNNLSRDEIEECIYMKVDAIITFLVPNDDAILLAKNTNVPVLLFGRNDDRGYLYCYSSNDFEGGQIASKYLINEKCKKLLYVSIPDITCSKYRSDGFVSFAEKYDNVETQIVDHEHFFADYEGFIREGFDGYFFFDDAIGVKFLNYINKNHPSYKAKIIGFNAIGKYIDHQYNLTSIATDFDLMVEEAITSLIRDLETNYVKPINKVYPVFLHKGEN